MLRSMLHGYVTLEAAVGYQYDTDIDDSFIWMVHFIDHGLHATTSDSGTQRRSALTGAKATP
jgi:hypothetical protein